MEKIDGVPVIELYAGYQVKFAAAISSDDIKENSATIKGTSDGTKVYYTNNPYYQGYTGEALRAEAKKGKIRHEQKRSAGSQNGNLRIFMFIRIIRKTERGSVNQRSGTLR